MRSLFAICVLAAAVEAVTGDENPGVRTVCGLAIALTLVRGVLQYLD